MNRFIIQLTDTDTKKVEYLINEKKLPYHFTTDKTRAANYSYGEACEVYKEVKDYFPRAYYDVHIIPYT